MSGHLAGLDWPVLAILAAIAFAGIIWTDSRGGRS